MLPSWKYAEYLNLIILLIQHGTGEFPFSR